MFKGDIRTLIERWLANEDDAAQATATGAGAQEARTESRAPYKRLGGLGGKWFASLASHARLRAASAGPLSNGLAVIPDNGIENVRMICNEYGRCWRERGQRRVIIDDSYNYAPRERYIERRGYYDGGYTTMVRA